MLACHGDVDPWPQIPIEQMSSADRHSILTEIKVLSMLHHPNVIEYYENFLQDKSMIIVMEFAAGGTLFDLLETRRKEARHLEEAELAHLFAQGGTNIEHLKQTIILILKISTPSTCHIVELSPSMQLKTLEG